MFRLKIRRLTVMKGIFFHVHHKCFAQWRIAVRASRVECIREHKFAVIHQTVAKLLGRFELAVLRVWKSETKKAKRYWALYRRTIGRFRLGPFADVFLIWKHFTMAIVAMYLPSQVKSRVEISMKNEREWLLTLTQPLSQRPAGSATKIPWLRSSMQPRCSSNSDACLATQARRGASAPGALCQCTPGPDGMWCTTARCQRGCWRACL